MTGVSRLGRILIFSTIVIGIFMLFTNIFMLFPAFFTLQYNNYVTSAVAAYNNYLTTSDIDNCTKVIKDTPMYKRGYITNLDVAAVSMPEGESLVSTDNTKPAGTKNRGHEFKVYSNFKFHIKISILGKTALDAPILLSAEKIVLGTSFYNDLDD